MSAVQRLHKAANDALDQIAACLPAEAEICLAIYMPGKPESDIVLKGPSTSIDEVVSTLRRRALSIDGDNAYKRDICNSIVGTLAFGAQDRCPPPEGYWAQTFWDMGRDSAANTEELISTLELVTECLSKALTGGEVSAQKAGTALVSAAELLAKQTR